MSLDRMAGIMAEVEGTGRDYIEYNIARFVQILRHLGVRVSLSETMDALGALARVDILQREQVRGVLRACLAKSRREAGIFDQAFKLFFTSPEEKRERQRLHREMQREKERVIQEAQQELMEVMEEWQKDLPEKIVLTESQLETFSLLPEEEKERMKEILERMQSNPVNNPGELINSVLQSSLNYWRYHLMKNMAEKGKSRPALEVGLTGDEEMDEVIQAVAAEFYHNPGDRILHQDMESLQDSDIPRITALINHMSSQIALGMSRRYKKSARAVSVDIRRTVRRNIRCGGIPIELRYRSRRKKRPRFLLICDVSASMARYARFIIQFIYGLSSALSGMESFIFSEDLERVTHYFTKQKPDFARIMSGIMNDSKQWGKSTNLHVSLNTFKRLYGKMLTSETIVFIVSDTRTVAPGEAAELLADLKMRCWDIFWLNTLPEREWAGQPQIRLFKRVVEMYPCNTLSQLEKAMRRHVVRKI
ncbi:MAG: vWA domain-containing protein [Bacillota bacterium]